MNSTKLSTRQVSDIGGIKNFFDDIAADYQELHGKPSALLAYRISIITSLLGAGGGTLLEIGCGTGIHLFALTEHFDQLIGTDLSPRMIDTAEGRRTTHAKRDAIKFVVDSAENLCSVAAEQVDCVLCVGAFEHMLDKDIVLAQVKRVLKSGGVFICLTPNAHYIWYRWVGPLLGCDTQHLSTDRFLTQAEIRDLLVAADFVPRTLGYWRFVPRGDMAHWLASLLGVADIVGLSLNISGLRGGIYFNAVKPR